MIKTLSNLLKQDKEKYKVPRKVQDVIPIRRMCGATVFFRLEASSPKAISFRTSTTR